ncbi:MAG: hypothetical protein KDK01_11320 [Rhodobacteraceae bacterium]|nr:hypothetical protein [Paracoccaceae bacterium]
MKIDAAKDFRRPRAAVLQMYRSPERIESVLRDLGAQVERTAEPPRMAWQGALTWHDEPRQIAVTVQETVQDETFAMTVTSDLALADLQMDFYDLPDGGCRVLATAEVTAKSMIAKLALQSLRLVRGMAEERLARFVMVIGRP